MLKLKVAKKFPGGPQVGTILCFDENARKNTKVSNLTLSDCEKNPEFFEKVVLTTDDKVDMFNNEIIYMLDDNKITKQFAFLSTRQLYPKAKFYSTREKAELHLHKFKVGDIVKTRNDVGRIKSIFEDITRWETPYMAVHVEYYIGESVQEISNIRLATEKEIENYYKDMGWRIGCSFKYKDGSIYKLSKLSVVAHRMWAWYKKTDKAISLSALLIDECELIRCEYPKKWEQDLKLSEAYNIDHFAGKIVKRTSLAWLEPYYFTTESQAKSALAFAKLTQLHAVMLEIYNKENNCNWKPVYSTTKLIDPHHKSDLFVVVRNLNKIEVNVRSTMYHHLVFPTRELAEFSLLHHGKLWEQYYELY
jgi:hypothetical protein